MNAVNGRFPCDGISFHLPGVALLAGHLFLFKGCEVVVIFLRQLPNGQTEPHQSPLIFGDDQAAQFALDVLRAVKGEIIQVPGNLI